MKKRQSNEIFLFTVFFRDLNKHIQNRFQILSNIRHLYLKSGKQKSERWETYIFDTFNIFVVGSALHAGLIFASLSLKDRGSSLQF
jgi:hypothetical protein